MMHALMVIFTYFCNLFKFRKDADMSKITINNSKAEKFHKQTNNDRSPFVTCFPSSMINAAETVRVIFPEEPAKTSYYTQEEDQYDWFLHTDPDVVNFWNQPQYKHLLDVGSDPREIWDVEHYAFNKWVGHDVCKLTYNLTVEKILEVINNGGAVVTSGIFNNLRHLVCIVGYIANRVEGNLDKTAKDASQITDFIVDDSYGNPHTGYKPVGVNGNDVVWDKNEFLDRIRKDGGKYWGIIFDN